MKRIGVYVNGHDALRAALRSGLPTIGAHYCERSLADHTRGQTEAFDLVLVVAPARNADAVIAEYKARGVPPLVLVIDGSAVTDPSGAAAEFVAGNLAAIQSKLYGTAPQSEPQRSDSDDGQEGQGEVQAEVHEAEAQPAEAQEAVSEPRHRRRR
jgi:hypothetical protein